MEKEKIHIPVLLKETLESLNIKKNGTYIDLTLGRAGHSTEILKKIPEGLLISFDKDKEAIEESKKILSKINNNFKLIHSDYKNIKKELNKMNIFKVDGIIADLGVSSPQLDNAERGFSYSKNSRLDMRMDRSQKIDAYFILNNWKKEQIIDIFKKYSNSPFPSRIAEKIIENRPVETTLQLVEIIKKSLPAAIIRKKNPSKNIFQAIRIAVNNEMNSLVEMLKDAPKLLKNNSCLSIITFHSIEDKIVKLNFKEYIKDETGKLPIIIEKKWRAKIIKPSKEELNINKRSRSGKLRILKKYI